MRWLPENPTLTEIEIGVVVPSLLYAPILIAEHRGFLAEEGLRVTFRSFGTTNGVTEALRDGVVPVTVGSPERSILDAVKGGDLRVLAPVFVNKPPLSMIAQRRYHSLADLRDARLGTSSLTEGTCHLMEQMMAAHDLHQPKDFQFVLAGAHPQRWEALKAGTLDAAIQLVPFNYIAEEAGFPNLGDVDDYVPDFFLRDLHASGLGRRAQGHPDRFAAGVPPRSRGDVRGSRGRRGSRCRSDADKPRSRPPGAKGPRPQKSDTGGSRCRSGGICDDRRGDEAFRPDRCQPASPRP